MTKISTDWMQYATCRNVDVDVDWTSDTVPRRHEHDLLATICSVCPVRGSCANYALQTEAQIGMYGGVWLPSRAPAGHTTPNMRWKQARHELAMVVARGDDIAV